MSDTKAEVVRLMVAYARTVESTHRGVTHVFYKIASQPHHLFQQHGGGEWRGPYRDKTDAENAAHDEAKIEHLELEWIYG